MLRSDALSCLQCLGLILCFYDRFIRPAKEFPVDCNDDSSCLLNLAKQVISLFHTELWSSETGQAYGHSLHHQVRPVGQAVRPGQDELFHKNRSTGT